ncbi:hypothetical protein [Bacillus sp. LLTC93]|uniref:hypothetical protein n=1 Tax=Bacillus sp. LLTC93 TaxID=2108274 RepID=UPI000D01768F|nr:hypothetical protein [Bacillus sp. LLTC93]PRO39484.1 hypothetical protein C6W18_19490 [Bacillus sp. LLTC93]
MKKKVYTLDELNAYRIAYGQPIQRTELLMSLFKPFIIVFVVSFLLMHYWTVSCILGGLAMFYGYRVMIPISVKRVYNAKAFKERHNFINSLTQILSNENTTVLNALDTVANRASGQFKEDLLTLRLSLQGATTEQINAAYEKFAERYKDDVIFDLYIEQLTTATIEGRTNINTIKNIKHLYNQLKRKQEDFFKMKQRASYEFRLVSIISLVLLLTISVYPFGMDQFVNAYAHQPVGWLTNSIYLTLMGVFFHSYMKRIGDDEVMKVKI